MGRLYSKGRQSLLGDTLEMLVLGHHILIEELRTDIKIRAQMKAGVDWQQILDEFEARMQGALFADVDSDASVAE